MEKNTAKPPEWLGEFGKEEWKRRIVANPNCNVDDLAMYCEAYHEFRVALTEIESEGATSTSDKGNAYQHPAVGRKNKAIERMNKLRSTMEKQKPVGKQVSSRPRGL